MVCDLQEGLPGIPSLRKRLEIALDVAKALQYLHAEELIHRDVKAQNVLVSNDFCARYHHQHHHRHHHHVAILCCMYCFWLHTQEFKDCRR